MAAPKKRQSLSRRRIRRNALDKLKTLPLTVTCKNCLNHRLPHHMCAVCGYYKNKLILAPKIKKEKKETPTS